MLYQVYKTGKITAGKRTWEYKIGSITFPNSKRGWQSTLFIHACAPIADDPKEWLEVTVDDETQQPAAAQLAGILKTLIAGVDLVAAPPSTRPASRPGAVP
jgi:hypothetical protein